MEMVDTDLINNDVDDNISDNKNVCDLERLVEWLEECDKYLDEDEENKISSLTIK